MGLTRSQVSGLAEACLALGEEASDDSGFVPVRRLLNRFDAELVMRPMLVEAILCEAADQALGHSLRWRLLVDNEKYRVTSEQVDLESATTPLPERFRNTIAHELTHSLAFRAKEFGVALTLPVRGAGQTSADLVADIERRTEQLSPLLLMPNSVINRWFPSSLPRLSLEHLINARKGMGVSRYVLVQRLNLLAEYGNPRFIERPCFQSTIIGVGTWTREGTAVLGGWPLFAKFYNGEAPAFVYMLRKAKTMGVSAIITDPEFALNGGTKSSIVVQASTGTALKSNSQSLMIELSVESVRAHPGATFLFLGRGVAKGG
jgi:hypothetical protein